MRYLATRSNGVNGGLLDFPRTVDDLFHRVWGMRAVPAQTEAWKPLADIVETPEAYVLRLEIPGVDPEHIELTVTGDTISVRGEKALDEKLEDETWRRNERLAGKFERTFQMPTAVSDHEVEAEARHGVLTIRVLKAREDQPQRIQIRKS